MKTNKSSVYRKFEYGLLTHMNQFNTEEKCRKYLLDVVWDGRPTCPHCGNNHLNYILTRKNIHKCSKCHKQFSLTQGTVFERTKLPLVKWFHAIYLFTTMKRSISSCQLAKLIEVHQGTAWYMLHRLRQALNLENAKVLTGEVQIDETTVKPHEQYNTRLQRKIKQHNEEQEQIHGQSKAKKRRLRGHPAKRGRKPGSTREVLTQKKLDKALKGKKQPFGHEKHVFGMQERGGDVVLVYLGNKAGAKSIEALKKHMKTHISLDSMITTDGNPHYEIIGEEFKSHEVVIHEKTYVTKKGVHTNAIENVWLHLKKMISGTYFHLSPKHITRYLNEHSFRWNRKKHSELSIFQSFMDKVRCTHIRYQDLTAVSLKSIA